MIPIAVRYWKNHIKHYPGILSQIYMTIFFLLVVYMMIFSGTLLLRAKFALGKEN